MWYVTLVYTCKNGESKTMNHKIMSAFYGDDAIAQARAELIMHLVRAGFADKASDVLVVSSDVYFL